jgi:hypothetical protein
MLYRGWMNVCRLCSFNKNSLPSGARLAGCSPRGCSPGCSSSRSPSSLECLQPRASARPGRRARQGVHGLVQVLTQAAVLAQGARGLTRCSLCLPRVAQCLRWGTGELHTLLPTSALMSSFATTRPPFVLSAR